MLRADRESSSESAMRRYQLTVSRWHGLIDDAGESVELAVSQRGVDKGKKFQERALLVRVKSTSVQTRNALKPKRRNVCAASRVNDWAGD